MGRPVEILIQTTVRIVTTTAAQLTRYVCGIQGQKCGL